MRWGTANSVANLVEGADVKRGHGLFGGIAGPGTGTQWPVRALVPSPWRVQANGAVAPRSATRGAAVVAVARPGWPWTGQLHFTSLHRCSAHQRLPLDEHRGLLASSVAR